MHNILITGAEHADRIEYAIELSQKQLCQNLKVNHACKACINCQRVASRTHPNIIFIEPEKTKDGVHEAIGLIKIDQVRRIAEENQKAVFEDGVGIFVITHMHRATKSAANALLKAIEENHPKKMFMALAPSKMAVLKTIASRMIVHSIKPPLLDSIAPSENTTAQITIITNTPQKDRFLLCAQFSADRDELMKQLDELLEATHALMRKNEIFLRQALLLSDALMRSVSQLEKNLNPRLVTENLVLREWPFIGP